MKVTYGGKRVVKDPNSNYAEANKKKEEAAPAESKAAKKKTQKTEEAKEAVTNG